VVMYVIFIVIFYRYANHIFVSHFIRANHGVVCKLPPSICMAPICGKRFSFGEERIGSACCHGMPSSYCIIK
jgi:hypothetical protein